MAGGRGSDQLTFEFNDDEGGLRAYVISALTGLSETDYRHVLRITDVVRDCLEGYGFHVHVPKDWTDPNVHGDLAPRTINAVDYDAVLYSDLVVMIADWPTSGGGKELVWAERNGCAILILSPIGSRISRLITGSCCDVEEHVWPNEDAIDSAIRSFTVNRRTKLTAHAAMRRSRGFDLAVTFARARALVASLDDATVRSRANWLTSDRIAEITENPHQFDNASLTELRQLGKLGDVSLHELLAPETESIDLRLEPLEGPEVDALLRAAELRGWDSSMVAQLIGKALRPAPSGYSYRSRLRDVEDWVDLADS
jgi:hypothetical protein